MAALEEAAAAARVAALVAAGDKGAVRTWLDDVLEQVEKQVADDEDRAERERDLHDRFIRLEWASHAWKLLSVALSNNRQYPSPSERSMLRPF